MNTYNKNLRNLVVGLMTTAISSAVAFCLMAGIAAADPHGWAAWRVGTVCAAVVCAIGLTATLIATLVPE